MPVFRTVSSAATLRITEKQAAMTELPSGIEALVDAGDFAGYLADWSRARPGEPRAVLLPRSPEQVREIVLWAVANRIPLVPSGGRTGLSGGAVPRDGEVVVSLSRMNRILRFDPIDRTISAEAGVVTQVIQDAARKHGLFYPVDFSSRGSSQIGGNVATNAGGIRVLRYGLTRDWVMGLKVVTGTGEVLDLNRGLVKNATGLDLRHLFIGCEGVLGIIVEVTVRLSAPPPPQQVMLLALPAARDLMPVLEQLRERLTISAFECFCDRALAHVVATGARSPFSHQAPMYALVEFDEDPAAALEAFDSVVAAGHVVDGLVASSHSQAAELWRLREGITESLSKYHPYKNDIAVRVSDIPAFLSEAERLFSEHYPSLEVVWFGHIGDGNLHVSVLMPSEMMPGEFMAQCEQVTEYLGALLARFGGSISAEHGIGLMKKRFLGYSRSAAEIALMRGVKAAFDPAGILNPGKIFDP